MKNCPNCNKETTNPKYCSIECYYDARRKIIYERVCPVCNKTFTFKNGAYARLQRMRYCSHECKNRKYIFDESYFSGELTPEKLVTLGQMVACAEFEYQVEVKIFSNLETLNDIQNKIGSNYKPVKSDGDLWRVNLKSKKLLNDLADLGVVGDKLYQDVPREDLWEGLKSTHCYKEEEGMCIFQTNSSKISRWIEDKFGGQVVTKVYRYAPIKNQLACYYINIWENNSNK